MRNPSLLCLRSSGAHCSLFILYKVTGRLQTQSAESLPMSINLFPGCRKSLLLLGQFFLILVAIFNPFSPAFPTLIDGLSLPHSPFPTRHLPAQPQARTYKQSHWAPATAMNVVLQVLPHPTPETTGQIKTLAELRSKALPWGGAAGGRGQRAERSGPRGRQTLLPLGERKSRL